MVTPLTLVDTCESVHQYQHSEQGRHTITYIAIGQPTQQSGATQLLLQYVGSSFTLEQDTLNYTHLYD